MHASNVAILVACTAKGVIGLNNEMPWPSLKGDLPRFKELTMGKVVVMGRKTWESLPGPLLGRTCIVVTRSATAGDPKSIQGLGVYLPDNTFAYPSLTQAMLAAKKMRDDTHPKDAVFIIGGGEIYDQALLEPNLVDRMYVTKVNREYMGDTVTVIGELMEDALENPEASAWQIESKVPAETTHTFLTLVRNCSVLA